MRTPRAWLVGSWVVALLVTACGGGTSPSPSAAASAPPTAGPTASAPASEPAGSPSGEPIRIGVLTSLTGNFAPWGLQARDGMQFAVDEINAAGGAGGRPLELVVADDQSNPEEGAKALERLIDQDKVIAVGGVISSDVALSATRIAEDSEVPLFLIKAGAGSILTAASRYTFRTCLPAAPMVAGPILQYAQSKGLTKVGAIVADYAWGQAIKAALEASFAAAPDIKLQVEVAPVPETDFTTYLRALETFGPEIIVATGHPPGAGAITVQSADLGFDVPITGAYTPRALVVSRAGDAAIGRYADFGCADFQSEAYQELARRFVAFSPEGTFMEDDAVAGYGIVTVVAEASGTAGDDPAAIAAYVHANTFATPGYSFELGWTEWGELAKAQIAFDLINKGPAPEGVNEDGAWYPERLLVSDPLEPFRP